MLHVATPTPTPSPGPVEETAEVVVQAGLSLLYVAWRVGAGALVGLAAAAALALVLSVLGRRRALLAEFRKYSRSTLYLGGALTGAWLGLQYAYLDHLAPDWVALVSRLLLAGVVLAGAGVVVALVKAVEASIVTAVEDDGDLRRANRIKTQAQVLRRVIQVVIVLCGLAGAAMVFPSARLAMGSLLASAGLVSVIAGLAAQSTLGNVFAGLQLAATDAIRVGDVVKADLDQGTVEEITLTYVVVRIWDDRRVIYPSSHFTTNPFSNLSRRGTQLTGTVSMQLDFRVPVERLRAELERVVAQAPGWDGREASLQVTDAVAGVVTVRIVLSGRDTSSVFDLQCYVREHLLTWLQTEVPEALPRTRVVVEADPGAEAREAVEAASGAAAGGLPGARPL